MPFPQSTFFIDTSFHLAFFFKKEQHHKAARTSIARIRKEHSNPFFVTTDLIFQETLSIVHRTRNIGDRYHRARAAIRLGADITKFNKVYPLDTDMIFMAWDLFVRMNQKSVFWEFTDCSSFVFIREIRKGKYKPDNLTIQQVLSFDGHYQEAAQEFRFRVVC